MRVPRAAILIPWRDTGCPHRQRAFEYVTARYRTEGYDVAVGVHEEGPWRKAEAVVAALDATDAEVLVIADADVWCDGLPQAITRVQEGAPWGAPHKGVFRLTEASTDAFLAEASLEGLRLAERAYSGVEGGGIVVLRRAVYEACPIDARYTGWGGEDEAFGWALWTLFGRPWRGKAQLAHLWHPPAERMTRARGSVENDALRKRYARALHKPDEMKSLIEEGRHDAHRALEPARDDHSPLVQRGP